MDANAERLLNDLHKLTTELERCLKGTTGKWAGEAGEQLHDGLAHARKRIAAIEADLRGSLTDGADAADHYVRSNPWQSIGVAVAVAFVVGALVSRRD